MLLEVLRKYWGYESLRPLQEEAMQCVLTGRDSLVVLPTGGGKSLCWQVPALCRTGLAVVVSPLISLMKDQVDSLRACGVPAAFINSTQTASERAAVASSVRSGELRLLYIAPERLVQDRTIEFLRSSALSFIAIDEAHCISEWGHDFRPEYRALKKLREAFPETGLHAFTATATESVRRDVCEQLGLREPHVLIGSFDRPNLIYRVERRDDLLEQIQEILQRHRRESGIIYCTTRKDVESLTERLNAHGHPALPYHAGLSDDERHRHQDQFIHESVDIIVATVAFGMGIDKSNVRYVIHAGMPKSLENYQQESGRAGRDGLEAECVLLYSTADIVRWKHMIEDAAASNQAAAETTLKAMSDYCSGVVCRHRRLVEYFGQSFEPASCNACDVCLGELDEVADALTIGQKILSSVIRQGQRFGNEYTALVLKGSKDERVRRNRHDALSTWGLLEAEPLQTIREWIDQLTSQGFLQRTGEYGVLEVTPAGWEVLRGTVTPRLMRGTESKQRQSRRSARLAVNWEGVDRDLFDEFRILRHDLAEQAGVPAYVIFTDETLRELARVRPSSLETMRSVKGIGEKKLADFGDTFLECIWSHCRESDVAMDVELAPDATAARGRETQKPRASSRPSRVLTAEQARELFLQNQSVEDVAQAIGRAKSTTLGLLTTFLTEEGRTSAEPWLDDETLARVEVAVLALETRQLTPVFRSLGGSVSFDQLRIAMAVLANRGHVFAAPATDISEAD